MNSTSIADALIKEFSHNPTEGQIQLIEGLAQFLCSEKEDSIYVIRGYAGTGKTTLVSALVKILPHFSIESVLLAPTGRAAKVLASYSGKQAITIHKKIYQVRTSKEGDLQLIVQRNQHRNTLFIVDEASMIYDSAISTESDLFSGNRLLEDFFTFIRNGYKCRIILIGDTAQLPPVGMNESPALDIKYLTASFHLKITTYELTEVVRQAEDSGILANATFIRNQLKKQHPSPPFFILSGYKDVIRIQGSELEEALYSAYSKSGKEGTLIICRSNKRANIFNREIRNRILGFENEVTAGDLLMTVRNNYFWLSPDSQAGFIANGDIIEVLRVQKIQELYGFRFADLQVRLLDYPGEKDLEVRVLLDTLQLEAPALPWKENKKFFDEVIKDYMEIPKKYERIQKVKTNPFFNALQVKYAYALTCHKSQGGQWEHVFVEQGYLTDEMIDKEYMRWLYTAVTRATSKLHLVNYSDKFFM